MLKIQKNHNGLVSKKDSEYQIGVFAYTDNDMVMLVTSRSGDSWILPKGNRAKKRSDRVQVKREAFEEAGLQGALDRRRFDFKSSGNSKKLRIYSMRIRKLHINFPEKKERKRILLPFDQAEKIVKKEYLEVVRELRKRVS